MLGQRCAGQRLRALSPCFFLRNSKRGPGRDVNSYSGQYLPQNPRVLLELLQRDFASLPAEVVLNTAGDPGAPQKGGFPEVFRAWAWALGWKSDLRSPSRPGSLGPHCCSGPGGDLRGAAFSQLLYFKNLGSKKIARPLSSTPSPPPPKPCTLPSV